MAHADADASEGGGDYEDNFDASLFLNEEYETVDYEFGGTLTSGHEVPRLTQPLLASTGASTDWDLTGQIVWPVSVFLGYYVVQKEDKFRGKHVCELGAGCGLSGLVASQAAGKTVLTDGNDVIVRLLERNAARQMETGLSKGDVSAALLLWGDEKSFERYVDRFGVPEVLLGADVVCWPQYVAPLVQTTKAFMQRRIRDHGENDMRLVLGYVVRAENNHRLFLDECAAHGLVVAEADPATFVPEPTPPQVVSGQRLQLLCVTLDAAHPRASDPVVFSTHDEGTFNH